MLVDERATVAAAGEELPEGQRGVVGLEQRRSLAEKAKNVAQHAPKSRAHEVSPLGEQPTPRAGIFEAGRLVAHREAHVAELRLDAQLTHDCAEVRIGVL